MLILRWKKELKINFGIEKIALLDSYARDEQQEDSYIYLLIVSIDKKGYFNRVHTKYFLEEYFKKSVDIGYFDSIRNFLKKNRKGNDLCLESKNYFC